MPKAKQKSGAAEGGDDTAPLQGVINVEEVELHCHMLEDILEEMSTRIEKEDPSATEEAITRFKDTISRVVPQVTEADVAKVIGSIANPKCLALMPRTEEREQLLEEVMLLEDILSGSNVISSVENSEQDTLWELFEDLEVAHEHTSKACSGLAQLSSKLSGVQLMAVLKASR